MKKLLIISIAVTMLAAAIPAMAWDVTWSEGFEGYLLGDVPGPSNAPVRFGLASAGKLPAVVQNQVVRTGNKAMMDSASPSAATTSIVANTIMPTGVYSYNGWLRGYVWDPGDGRPSGSTVGNDARLGIHSTAGSDNIGKIASANLTDGRSTAYWTAQWSYSVATLDGTTTPAGGAGYTWTQGAAAPRVFNSWTSVLIKFGFTYSGTMKTATVPNGTGWVQWYINSTSVPGLRVDIDSTSGRWDNFWNVNGVTFGSLYAHNNEAAVDDLSFSGNVVPEPGSMLALGAGLMGLAGMIRRRR